jgi:hypothetical protein
MKSHHFDHLHGFWPQLITFEFIISKNHHIPPFCPFSCFWSLLPLSLPKMIKSHHFAQFHGFCHVDHHLHGFWTQIHFWFRNVLSQVWFRKSGFATSLHVSILRGPYCWPGRHPAWFRGCGEMILLHGSVLASIVVFFFGWHHLPSF